MYSKISIIIISIILVTAAILTVQSSSLSMLQSSYAQSCPEGVPVDASGNCATTSTPPPPADDGGTTQAPPPPATTEAPPPATQAPPPPATTEAPPPATQAPPPPATTEAPPPATQAPPANASQVSNTTGGMSPDWANSILAVHNSERAAVGVAPLVWNNSLAARAQAWAEHIATTGAFAHDPDPHRTFGENIAGFAWSLGPTAPGEGTSLWIDEKKNYHGQAEGSESVVTGHYTQMVWRNTQEVGCGAAPPGAGGLPFGILVCRYNPPGNVYPETAY
jgi:pathogenesis-related protein 1